MKNVWIAIFSALLLILSMGSALAYVHQIDCTNVTLYKPVKLNNTFTINGNLQVVYAGCRPNMTINGTNQSDYRVWQNGTIAVPFEVAIGNGTSYFPAQVWTDAGFKEVFHMNECSGSTIRGSVSGANGTISGATWSTNAESGCALNFTSFSDKVNFSTDSELVRFEPPYSVDAWANLNGEAPFSQEGVFIGDSDNSAKGCYLEVPHTHINFADLFQVYIGVTPPYYVSSAAMVDDTTDTWHLVSWQLNGTDFIFRSDLTSESAGGYSGNGTVSDLPVLMGAQMWGDYGTTGLFDELRITNGSAQPPSYYESTYYNSLGTVGYGTFDTENMTPPENRTGNFTCFQEFANASTPCGGQGNGSYYYDGGWEYNSPPSTGAWLIDGNYSTGAYLAYNSSEAYFYANYTKPTNANNAKWQAEDECHGLLNYTLPDDCWYNSLGTVNFRVIAGSVEMQYYCLGASGYHLLGTCAQLVYSHLFYEEGVWWNINTPACVPSWNCTSFNTCTANVTACLAVTDENACGSNFTGNLSDYNEGCCNPNFVCNGYGTCVNSSQNCNHATDLNTCGNIYTGNYSEFSPQACTTPSYMPTYGSGDFFGLIVDLLAKGLLVVISLIGVVVVVSILIWGYKKMRGR